MAYSEFTFKKIEAQFNIKNRIQPIFAHLPSVEPSNWLQATLEMTRTISPRTEKEKSEAIVFPILMEVKQRNDELITLYSGEILNGDDAVGLVGECDFIIARGAKSLDINCPIIQIVEAKKHDIDLRAPQCAAQMLGARVYNEKNKTPLDVVYGCVTTGDDWLFLKLESNMLYADQRKYYLSELGELLAVFQHIINSSIQKESSLYT